MNLLKKLFGTSSAKELKAIKPLVDKIEALDGTYSALSDEELKAKTTEFKERLQKGETLDDILPEAFAACREAAWRVLGMKPYRVQLIGGIILHQGRIAEMKTGEGKTLVATLPAYLNALAGEGVHIVTVNDYLAKRDSEWMGKVYRYLGLTVGLVIHDVPAAERKAAYAADVTYGTNNEFGFDYLRDNMVVYKQNMVQRGHAYAIVDEVDSILIDEARTPLIISGASDESTGLYRQMDEVVRRLQPEVHFTVDEKARTAMLTEEGVAQCERILSVDNLFDPASITLQHHILQSLRAHHAYRRDVDYIVNEEGKVLIVDEFTGRLMPGRRFGDGLHQALEAKEHVKIEAENQTLASITFQNYFRMYDKLSGMTGTAQTEAVEFTQIYGLETITVPTNKPMIRKDYPDLIYRTQREKYNAIVQAIRDLHAKGQPVLVGTISIETSELLSSMLKKEGVPHNVLNAKHHAQEAEIVAQAGQAGRVTIATNMAGRGTDIVLGEGVQELGGLHILGTERHESRRIDNQLRGRSGRQGDPGSSRFYLSLEDNLMRIFGSERISGLMEKLGMVEGEPIENKMVSRAIENAQKRVEGHNFEIRKTLLDYDNVMNQQREVIYGLRRDLMMQPAIEPVLYEFLDELLDDIYAPLEADKHGADASINAQVMARLLDVLNIARVLPDLTPDSEPPSREAAREAVTSIFAILRQDAGPIYEDVLRYFLLEELDRNWKDHLRSMDHLREGIGLRGYGQRDPKLEYKKEGFAMFQELVFRIREGALRALTRVRVQQPQEAAPAETPEGAESDAAVPSDGRAEESSAASPAPAPEAAPSAEPTAPAETPAAFRHKENPAASAPMGRSRPAAHHIESEQPKVGRNDPCPCGSGKKYKKCCGAGN